MNTQIEYFYRDGGNWKTWNECIIKGEMTEEQEKRIIACLEDGEYIIPSRIHADLPENANDSDYSDQFPMFEWSGGFTLTDAAPDIDLTVEELVARFEEMKNGWRSVAGKPETTRKPFAVTVRETYTRTVVVWAEDRLEAEKVTADLCAVGEIELNANDYTDRETICQGVASAEEIKNLGITNENTKEEAV